MELFYDTEFISRGNGMPIQLVSIGMIRTDGTALYRINPECLSNVVRHPWLSTNVAPLLPIKSPGPGILEWDEDHDEYLYVAKSLDNLVADVLEFIQGTERVELWADYSHYDHVALTQLFGEMGDLPAGVPMRTRDIQDLLDDARELLGLTIQLPPQQWNAHHAMNDARWTKEAYEKIRSVIADPSTNEPPPHSDSEVIEGILED